MTSSRRIQLLEIINFGTSVRESRFTWRFSVIGVVISETKFSVEPVEKPMKV